MPPRRRVLLRWSVVLPAETPRAGACSPRTRWRSARRSRRRSSDFHTRQIWISTPSSQTTSCCSRCCSGCYQLRPPPLPPPDAAAAPPCSPPALPPQQAAAELICTPGMIFRAFSGRGGEKTKTPSDEGSNRENQRVNIVQIEGSQWICCA